MGTKIQDLNISSFAKHALQNAGFTMVSELIGQNYITLVPKFPPHYNILAIIQELNPLGYLLPPENEKSIYDTPMSKRLLNILERNNLIYLSQLSEYPIENIAKLRNLGEKTLEELEQICKRNNIHIGSIQSIKDKLAQYNFPAGAYAKFYKSNISSLDDFNHKTAHDLYNICSQDYILTIKVYYILKKNGIILNDWNDKYLFEIMPEKTATRLWYRHQISTISQLSNHSADELKKLYTISPKLLSRLNTTSKIK